MATINKRGNTFQIVVSLGLDVNGKKIRKTTTYKPPENTTPKKAEKLAQEFAPHPKLQQWHHNSQPNGAAGRQNNP